jgi:hypothetical protein
MPPDIQRLWIFLPLGYLLSVLLETPVLFFGLAPPHSSRRRLLAGLWLTACTYPIVVLVLPLLITPRFGFTAYVAIAETFAPLAECALFYLAFDFGHRPRWIARDMVAIIAANLGSWLIGGWIVQQLYTVQGGP